MEDINSDGLSFSKQGVACELSGETGLVNEVRVLTCKLAKCEFMGLIMAFFLHCLRSATMSSQDNSSSDSCAYLLVTFGVRT